MFVPPRFSSVQSFSCVRLFATPWTAARQASLTITHSQSLLNLISIESVMPSNHLILCRPPPPAPSPSQHQGLFQSVSSSHQVAKVLELYLSKPGVEPASLISCFDRRVLYHQRHLGSPLFLCISLTVGLFLCTHI